MNLPTHDTCGCCEGITQLTPQPIANRPGLGALAYRVGTHAAFFQTMIARLSGLYLDIPRDRPDPDGKLAVDRIYPLAGLTTRAPDDPAIALLDAWAVVADVLTFYQERIANEGYLRTATERRSILELARLVGYAPRPGVAATVYLAYTIDDKMQEPVEIPRGARSQSVPGPGELPQSFETIEALVARASYNNLKPRLTRPQTPGTIRQDPDTGTPRVYLKGITTNLKPNDPLLIGFGATPELFRVSDVQPDTQADRTLVLVQPWMAGAGQGSSGLDSSSGDATVPPPTAIGVIKPPADDLSGIMAKLTLPGSVPPRNALQLHRSVAQAFGVSNDSEQTLLADRSKTLSADTGLQLIGAFRPDIARSLPAALPNVKVTNDNGIKVYALRIRAGMFGHNLAGQPNYHRDDKTGMITVTGYTEPDLSTAWPDLDPDPGGYATIALDAQYDKITPGDWIAIERPFIDDGEDVLADADVTVHQVKNTQTITRSVFGVSTRSTQLTIDRAWLAGLDQDAIEDAQFSTRFLRGTTVFAQQEELALAEEPIHDPVCGGADDQIELDGLYDGLKSGRWLIVTGERDDVKDAADQAVKGIKSSELVMLSEVIHAYNPALPGDVTHTYIRLAKKLAYCFGRDKITIYANVAKATHGETRQETLGSGDGARPLQAFTLRQPPLTFVAAPTPAGAESTLHVYVNNVEWHESDTLASLGPTDRRFIMRTDDDDKTTVIFGNGVRGARLPTGVENVAAVYRNGIGAPGNVRAEQISLLMTRPLGVKEVINPLRASGGADRESRDQARRNAPLALLALDRLVSAPDYAYFARTFAGIGKALAQRLPDGRRQLICVTIAGAGDIPIDETSDLFANLRLALRQYGDPDQPFRIAIRELLMLVISANVKLLPDYLWEPVATAIRANLLDTFSFERRELGQDVLLSEVISAIQAVEGVAYVDIDVLGGIPEKKADGGERRLLTPQEIAATVQLMLPKSGEKVAPAPLVTVNLAGFDQGTLQPAQLAFLTPAAPDTLILNQV